jgi:hypothetical protein
LTGVHFLAVSPSRRLAVSPTCHLRLDRSTSRLLDSTFR